MKILLGEDDAAITDVVTIILEGEGYTVLQAKTAEEILKKAVTEDPKLILLDISLSGSDGGAIARQLKRQDKTRTIPVIMLSANSETEAIAQKAGADGFLLKPFTMEDLIKTAKQYTS